MRPSLTYLATSFFHACPMLRRQRLPSIALRQIGPTPIADVAIPSPKWDSRCGRARCVGVKGVECIEEQSGCEVGQHEKKLGEEEFRVPEEKEGATTTTTDVNWRLTMPSSPSA